LSFWLVNPVFRDFSMLRPGFGQSALFGTTAAAIVLGLFGFAGNSLGAAIVGETRFVGIEQNSASGLEALKAQYRRPASIPFPKDNPYTPEKLLLGKKLYFDTRVSVSSAQSCASCHSPSFGWADGLPVGVGFGMAQLGRHSPTIVNAAWGAIFMWDGRLANLEEQALGPIQSPGEMNMPIAQLMERLSTIAEYKPLFAAAFPGDAMNEKTLAKAIATYERTVVSQRAPFDDWIDGNEQAISEEAKHAALPCSIPKPSALHAMKAGTSPTTASRISACRATMSGAASSCRASSKCSMRSRRRACGK
jgi:cytochrome c peroxidase